MPASMTAFSRQERQGDWGVLTIELRSVNHRYLDVSLRLPEELRALEPKLRERIARVLARGKVDCQLRYEAPESSNRELVLDKELAARVARATRDIDALLHAPAPISSLDVLRWPGVLVVPAADTERLQAEALALLDAALVDLTAMRRREGQRIREMLETRCAELRRIVAEVQALLPEIRQRWRERLTGRLEEVQGELDPGRLEQEMVIFAQRIDVAEELDRLQAHVQEVLGVLERDEPVGRRLDFLMQELNREANTLGSKSVDARSSRAAVDLKVLIEQMREQVQNVE